MADMETCRVSLNGGRLRLECRRGMTLFAALRMNKLYLPTGCGARGLCGQCKIRLASGDANPLTDSETRLIAETDRAAGYRLACQVRLSGDVAVEIPEQAFSARQRPVVVSDITPLTHDIRRFGLVLPEGDGVPHLAGQFINLSAKIPGSAVQPIRCFSFATPSAEENRIDIIVKRNPNGVLTPHMFEGLKVGDAMTVVAPFGDFHLHEGDSPCVWIAGGSGLSPFLGMLRDMLDKGNATRKVHLFFGAVNPDDLYYVDLLRDIEAKCPWFVFTPALSGSGRCDGCRDYGLVTDVVRRHVDDASGREGYLCGSPGMIRACVEALTEKGMNRDRIYYDRF